MSLCPHVVVVVVVVIICVQVLLAVTVSGGRHKNRNRGNKGEGRARCGVQHYTVQEKTYKQEVSTHVLRDGFIFEYSSVTMSMRLGAPHLMPTSVPL